MTSLSELRRRRHEARQPPLPPFQPVTWEVGVTTCPRIRPTLLRTLESLTETGWPRARLFVDGKNEQCQGPLATIQLPLNKRYPITDRGDWIGAVSNFTLGLAELYHRNPHADAYLMLQDDVIHTPGVRQWFEQTGFPSGASVCSWYCSSKYNSEQPGWFCPPPEKNLIGALTVAFTNESARNFIADKFVHEYRAGKNCPPAIKSGGTKHVDSLIGVWGRQGHKVFCHSPSLAQHIGDTSTMHRGVTNSGQRLATRMATVQEASQC